MRNQGIIVALRRRIDKVRDNDVVDKLRRGKKSTPSTLLQPRHLRMIGWSSPDKADDVQVVPGPLNRSALEVVTRNFEAALKTIDLSTPVEIVENNDDVPEFMIPQSVAGLEKLMGIASKTVAYTGTLICGTNKTVAIYFEFHHIRTLEASTGKADLIVAVPLPNTSLAEIVELR